MMDVVVAAEQMISVVQHGFWQPALTHCGVVLMVPAGANWTWFDLRTVQGESVALKPTRFALSISLYLMTAAARFACMQPDRRRALFALATVWMMLVGSRVELICIVVQAAHARRSHFNRSTRSDAANFATMGVFTVLFIGALLPLGWEIAHRPNAQVPGTLIQAIVAGLLKTAIVGGGTGGLMSGRGAAPIKHGYKAPHLPLLGWSIGGGDLRVPHFFGIHAMQALPMIAADSIALSSR